MTVEKLRDAYKAIPFKPFTIHLADGRAIPVHHQELVLAAPTGTTFVVFEPDDRLHILDLPLVTNLEFDVPGIPGPAAERGV